MKKHITIAVLAVAVVAAFVGHAKIITDTYDLSLRLCVPQVLENTQSLGRRVYKMQLLTGKMTVTYVDDNPPVISIEGLENKSYKVGGKPVTYRTKMAEGVFAPMLHYMGDNNLNLFKVATTCFYLEALPSYALDDADADNSFYLMFAGRGSTSKSFSAGTVLPKQLQGYLAGTQGCSCSAYGHTSPTREAGPSGPTGQVTDIAAVFGTWIAKFNRTLSRHTID